MKHRNSASFGKRQEYIAVAELLRRGFDVYMTLVDDQQIDCVIRQEKDGALRYLDVQIKARSLAAKHPGTFAALTIRKPRPNFWFMFYSEPLAKYWIIPSEEVVELANVNKGGATGTGKNKGKFTINLVNKNKKVRWKPRPKFSRYEDAFALLEWNGTTGSTDPKEAALADAPRASWIASGNTNKKRASAALAD